MSRMEGRNKNTTDEVTTTTVEINSVTATVLAVANPARFFCRVSLDSGVADHEAFIREYPAATDNNHAGILLTRVTSGNTNLLNAVYSTIPDNIYTGEISAIAVAGTFDLHVMEG